MITFNLQEYYKILLVISALINLSTTYLTSTLEAPDLCSPITKRKIKLGIDQTSGLIVSLGRLKDHSLRWDKNVLCKFQVDAVGNNNGLFAVIQKIVFRKNETTDECIDYVQYKRRDGASSKKHCGRLNAALGMDQIFAPDIYATNLAPTINSFVDPTGQLDVSIYISREALRIDEEMDLEIVFTSFRYCFSSSKNDRQCSEKHHERCIYKDLFNDGYVNCPYPDCVDEGGCSGKMYDERKKSIGNKVIIGSVTLLVVVFIFFICFIWLCRKYKKLCWAEDFASPNTTTQTTRTFEMNEPSRQISLPSSARADPPEPGPADEDKDLPPSYDSLFPNR